MAKKTTRPMRKIGKEEDDFVESKGGHKVNTRLCRPHTTIIEPQTGIPLSREASKIQDSRPLLPRKSRSTYFQKWVKNFDENGDPFKKMASSSNKF